MRLKSLPFSHANENRPFKWNNGIKKEREGAEKETRATTTGGCDSKRVATTLRKRAASGTADSRTQQAHARARAKDHQGKQ